MTYYHLGEIVHKQAEKYRYKTAVKYQASDGKWLDMSWKILLQKS